MLGTRTAFLTITKYGCAPVMPYRREVADVFGDDSSKNLQDYAKQAPADGSAQLLSREQVEKFDKLFQQFDEDKDGYIDSEQLGSLMRALGLNPTDAQLQALIKKYDTEGKQQIGFTKFITLMTDKFQDQDEQLMLLQTFKMFDKDGKGYISTEDLKKTMTDAELGGERLDAA